MNYSDMLSIPSISKIKAMESDDVAEGVDVYVFRKVQYLSEIWD